MHIQDWSAARIPAARLSPGRFCALAYKPPTRVHKPPADRHTAPQSLVMLFLSDNWPSSWPDTSAKVAATARAHGPPKRLERTWPVPTKILQGYSFHPPKFNVSKRWVRPLQWHLWPNAKTTYASTVIRSSLALESSLCGTRGNSGFTSRIRALPNTGHGPSFTPALARV